MGKKNYSGFQEKSTTLRRRFKVWKRGSRDQSRHVVDCSYGIGMKRKVYSPTVEASNRPGKRIMSYGSVESCPVSCSSCVESSSSSNYVNSVSYTTHEWPQVMCSGSIFSFVLFSCL